MPHNDKESMPYWVNNPTAKRLWDAFHRIITGQPKIVKKTAKLTLSSVAVEAGYQRSTLSRKRFPDLAEMIDNMSTKKPGETMHSKFKKKERAARNLRKRLEAEKNSNGLLINQLVNIEINYIQSCRELEDLRRKLGDENYKSKSNDEYINR